MVKHPTTRTTRMFGGKVGKIILRILTMEKKSSWDWSKISKVVWHIEKKNIGGSGSHTRVGVTQESPSQIGPSHFPCF